MSIETLDVDLPEGYAYRHIGIDIPAGPYVMLVVSDTGHGMTAEVKARLFEPFFTTKPATQNTGLGLATVYGIVVQSGGYIWVDSEPESGTAFKICFPRVDSEDEVVKPPITRTGSEGGSEIILLVEDEETVRSVARRILNNRGYTVYTASNGREALELAQSLNMKFDLVLTDIVMPDMGGVELVERLLQVQPGIKAVYMSGYAEGDKRDGLDLARSFLQKPFSTDSLTSKVREVLDARHDLVS